jgi:hypothetical protein
MEVFGPVASLIGKYVARVQALRLSRRVRLEGSMGAAGQWFMNEVNGRRITLAKSKEVFETRLA